MLIATYRRQSVIVEAVEPSILNLVRRRAFLSEALYLTLLHVCTTHFLHESG
jgi:hypothetical protein